MQRINITTSHTLNINDFSFEYQLPSHGWYQQEK
jgi:hypothetical protein